VRDRGLDLIKALLPPELAETLEDIEERNFTLDPKARQQQVRCSVLQALAKQQRHPGPTSAFAAGALRTWEQCLQVSCADDKHPLCECCESDNHTAEA